MVTLDQLRNEEEIADHIMVFHDAGKDANDALSIRGFESLMFLTQFFQLVLDFYLGFYLVHMSKRVSYVTSNGGMAALYHCRPRCQHRLHDVRQIIDADSMSSTDQSSGSKFKCGLSIQADYVPTVLVGTQL
eukprot:SAG31_NODE_17108_length_683_cov_1.061644_2_plen_132_part_00